MTRATSDPSLRERIKDRRAELMLSQKEAAAELGVSLRIFQAWEGGQVTNPRPRLRRRIEAWLNGRPA